VQVHLHLTHTYIGSLAKDFPLGPCWLRDQDGPHIGQSESSPAPSDTGSDAGSGDDTRSSSGTSKEDEDEEDVASSMELSTEGGEEVDPTFRDRLYCEVGNDDKERRIWRRSPEWIVRLCSKFIPSFRLKLENA
jgi:hypothetical protein